MLVNPGLALVALIASAACSAQEGRSADYDDTYDYIVVGGGTAGMAVAARLSEGLEEASILLIEAGPKALNDPKINIPGMKGTTLGGQYDWNFTTVPQSNVNNRVFSVNRGKVLGGTSALNLMTYNRASAPEYDSWEALGNKGWNWNNMIAAMKKSEKFTGKNTATYGNKGVGDKGPIQAVINRFIPKQQESWIPTMNKLDIKKNLESLGGNPLGVMYQPNNIDAETYTRSFSANAYLPLAESNLDILTGTTVSKINLKAAPGKGRKFIATGVTLSDGTQYKARKEVILSAGSIQSPGLLEMSGIGQKSVLAKAGVNQLIDLPGVGENYQDHLRIQSSYQLKPTYSSIDQLRANLVFAAKQLALWLQGKRSLYDYTGSAYTFMNWKQALGNDSKMKRLAKEAAAKDSSKVDKKKLEFLNNAAVPQLEVIFSDGYTGLKGYPAASSPLFGKSFFSLIAVVMHPMSRGSVHIASSDGKPVINPNYFAHEHDLEAAIQAIKYCRKIATTEPIRSLWQDEYEPGLNVNTDEQWKQFALNTTLSIYHPVGTCAMLPKKDGGVVDAKLKVHDTHNLRVVDASIIPVLISAHIQTAVYGIAERAAQMIIEDSEKH